MGDLMSAWLKIAKTMSFEGYMLRAILTRCLHTDLKPVLS